MTLSTIAAFAYYNRYVWAWPDVPYLTQLTALPTIGAALDGEFHALLAPYLRFSGEHRVGAYTTYLFFNAKFLGYSTATEIMIWSGSHLAQCALYGYFIFYRLRTRLVSAGALLSLLVPVVVFSPAFAPGRGMETQVNVSVTLFVGLALLITSSLRPRTVIPLVLVLSCIYAMGLAAGYFAVGTLAILTGTVVMYVLSRPGSTARTVAVATAAAMIFWALVYVVTMRLFASPGPAGGETLLGQIRADPLFPLTYFLRALGATVTTINASEYFGSRFDYVSVIAGVSVLAIVILTVTCVSRSPLARRFMPFPVMLVAYGLSVAVLVMVGRPEAGFWQLNTWYGFQYRPIAAGLMILGVMILNFRLARSMGPYVLLGGLAVLIAASTFAVTTRWQLQRNNAERAYFSDIRTWVLDPHYTGQQDALTPIYLSEQSSRDAITFLRERRLVPFR